MKDKRYALWIFVLILGWVSWARAQGNYKIEAAGAPPSSLPPAVQRALESDGTKVVNGQDTVCELWWSKSIPTVPNASTSPDIVYGNLGVGTFVGVIDFPAQSFDFRGQTIKPGLYTLRYALVPTDGNHMGVSTYRDFVLLSPVSADTHVDAVLSFGDLLKLSRQVTGTGHPAVMSLAPATADAKTLPILVQDDQGHSVLDVKLNGPQGFPFAIVVVGQYQG